MYVKGRFNFRHVTKVSAQTFSSSHRRIIKLGKALHTFLDFLTKKICNSDFEHKVDDEVYNHPFQSTPRISFEI